MFILNAFLFDDSAVQGGGGAICPGPFVLLSGLDLELPGMGNGSTEQTFGPLLRAWYQGSKGDSGGTCQGPHHRLGLREKAHMCY